MYPLYIPEREFFNESTSEFIYIKERTLTLEHSLLSLSKWESKWQKPFLDTKDLTYDQVIDYIRCMTVSSNVTFETLKTIITQEMIKEVWDYINNPMTATWFNDQKTHSRRGGRGQVVTSELIYFWMVSYGIPFTCEKWHLNRLLTLIKICEIKNSPSKKMTKKEIYSHQRELNEARKKKFGTKG